jgi:hypothetical protein
MNSDLLASKVPNGWLLLTETNTGKDYATKNGLPIDLVLLQSDIKSIFDEAQKYGLKCSWRIVSPPAK